MPESEFSTTTPLDRPDYRHLIGEVSEDVWPEFMFHDTVADEYWGGLFEQFADYQFALVSRHSGAVAGIANSVPLHWAAALEDLPDEGWDWALIKSAADRADGLASTVLCGLQISVTPPFQRRGLSRALLRKMVDLARSYGLSSVIIPVRPSIKAQYPLTSIDRYIRWTNDDGLPFDPWLRVQVRNGGRIVKPCPLAMQIPGTVAEWEGWTGMRFFESGDYIIPDALTPVRIDVERDTGLYVEPNVWVAHEVEGG